jgi:drug/metabolite transporter (DMT)-like permease
MRLPKKFPTVDSRMGVSPLLDLSPNHLGELAAVAMAFCATLSVMAWTSTGRHIGVIAVCCLRLTAASILFALWGAVARGLWLPTDIDGRSWKLLAISGVLGYFFSDFLAIKAYVIIGPRLTLLLYAIAPVMVTIYGYYEFGELLGAINVLGIAVTLGGVIWVLVERRESPQEIHRRKDFALGVVMAIGSAVLGGCATIYAKEAIRENMNLDPFAAMQIRILAALACYPPFLTLLKRWGHVGRGLRHARAMKILLCGTVIGPFLGMGLYMYALKVCDSTGIVSTISSISPVLILPISIYYYRENVSRRAILGALMTVLGVMLMMC